MRFTFKPVYILILLAGVSQTSFSQIDDDEGRQQGHEIFLVNDYEQYNKFLGGDSIRYCNEHPCNEWVRDLYPDGSLKHRGYYLDGQLASVYKNYYNDGQLEREFSVKSHRKSIMKIYYPTGQLLSEILYDYADPLSWRDFYPDGQIEYDEKTHKSKEYITHRLFYYPNGHLQSSIKLLSKKKLLYERMEYHENGNLKEKGHLSFNPSLRDYQKTGKWQFFDENGQLILEETYYKNRVIDDSEIIEEEEDYDDE